MIQALPYEYEITPEYVNSFTNLVKENVEMILKVIQGDSFSLDTRWKMYLKIQPYLPIRNDYWTPPCMNKAGFQDTWYDDFNLERTATQEFDDSFMSFVEEKTQGGEIMENLDMDVLKEEIIQSGIGGFINDW